MKMGQGSGISIDHTVSEALVTRGLGRRAVHQKGLFIMDLLSIIQVFCRVVMGSKGGFRA